MTAASLLLCALGATGASVERVDSLNGDGFTLLLGLGIGNQTLIKGQSFAGDVGGGINVGVGSFLTDDLAVMFRVSATNMERVDDVHTVSGVGVVALQYWVHQRINFEFGPGVGVIRFREDGELEDERGGLGFLAAVGFSFYQNKQSSLQLGFEFAPVFVNNLTIYNSQVALAWQML